MLAGMVLLPGGMARAQNAATLAYPTNGAQNVDTRLPFRWNAAAGAAAYRLQIGSAAPTPDPGSGGATSTLNPNLFDSGATATLSVTVPQLPANQFLYARLWTQFSATSTWAPSDSTFRAVARPATFINPTNGYQYVDLSYPFTWTAITGAQSYYLKIGTTLGGNELLNTGELAAVVTSYKVSQTLPAGQTLYGRISTKLNDRWWSNDITFQALPRAAIFTYPLNGVQNVDVRVPFAWAATGGAQGYYLKIGTTQGGADLLNSGELAASVLSYTVATLPTGQTLWARLWTKAANTWVLYSDVSFKVVQQAATFTYPQNGNQYVDQRIPFSWTPVTGAQGYYLKIGTSLGAQDVVNSGSLATSVTTYSFNPPLPSAQLLHGRISTKLNGIWFNADITFRAMPRPATLTYPTNGSQLVDTRLPFTWGIPAGAQGYYLKIGTTAGAQDILNSGELAASAGSCAVPALPTGQTLYARLWTKGNGAWLFYSDISFQAVARPSTFITPTNGNQYVDQRLPISWTAIAGAQGYYLKIGTSPTTNDILNTGTLPASRTSWALIQPLPTGQTLYARIATKLSDRWWESAISFQAMPRPATFIYPAGAQPVNARQYFSWTAVAEAQGYYLTVGTTPGGRELVDTGGLPPNIVSIAVPPMPTGQTLYARIWTQARDVWMLYTDIAFTVQAPYLTFTSPAQGSTGISRTPTLAWTAVTTVNNKAPLYRLTIGTTPAAGNVLTTGWRSANTFAITNALPAGALLYGRVQAVAGDGTSLFGDTVFTTIGAAAPELAMVYPSAADLQTAAGNPVTVNVAKPFAWNSLDLALAYRLQVYNGLGPPDTNGQPAINGLTLVRDSNLLHVPRVFLSDLPLGDYTVRLGFELNDGWHWRTFTITVGQTGADAGEQVQAGLWAVNYVRSMSDRTRIPYSWTLLPKYTANWPGASCLDCRETLLVVLQEMRLCENLPVNQQPRRVDINFTVYDTHSLAEMFNSADGRWVVLDATFAVAMTRTSDGKYATKEEIQQATLAQNWSAITYTPLSGFGDQLLRDYSVDYPLVYVNVVGGSVGNSVLPYLQSVTLPANELTNYCVQSPQQAATVLVDGITTAFDCKAVDNLSRLFQATTVVLPAGNTAPIQAFKVRRYVF